MTIDELIAELREIKARNLGAGLWTVEMVDGAPVAAVLVDGAADVIYITDETDDSEEEGN
jgi:hypothetical protein